MLWPLRPMSQAGIACASFFQTAPAPARWGVDYVDEPTFLRLPLAFENGTISVDLYARLLPDAPDYARGFIGLAYRIGPENAGYESVYLRPTNGQNLNPPAPRHLRAVQYYAYPDWKFDRLRAQEPDGPYEGPAAIALDEWMSLCLTVQGSSVTASVNGRAVLNVAATKLPATSGAIGLWVDIGTAGFFSNLQVTPA